MYLSSSSQFIFFSQESFFFYEKVPKMKCFSPLPERLCSTLNTREHSERTTKPPRLQSTDVYCFFFQVRALLNRNHRQRSNAYPVGERAIDWSQAKLLPSILMSGKSLSLFLWSEILNFLFLSFFFLLF